jgi:predicted O-methyltransferase YrrM
VLAPFRGRDNLHILEIGSYEGRSALWLLENIMTGNACRIDCVDIFSQTKNLDQTFDANTSFEQGRGRLRKLKGMSQEILRNLPFASYDAVYIDGSHATSDVLEDAVLAFRLLKPQGILIFDDYEWDQTIYPQAYPKLAINAFLDAYQLQYEILHKAYQLIIRKQDSSTIFANPVLPLYERAWGYALNLSVLMLIREMIRLKNFAMRK